MSAPLVVLFYGASHAGKSQLLCWHLTNQADPDTVPTFEENYEYFEEVGDRRETVTYVDAGGNASYAKMLEEWVSRCNAQVLVINLEDAASVSFLKSHVAVLTRNEARARILVGNLPSGKETNRVVTKVEAERLAATLFGTKVPYVETNTRNGEGVKNMFSTLMEQVHGVCVHTNEQKEVKPQPTFEQLLAEKDLEISALKNRQTELEATVAALASKVEGLEGKFSEAALTRRVEEMLLSHLKKIEWRRGPESDATPVKEGKPISRAVAVKQSLFTP